MRALVRLNIDHRTGTGHFFRIRSLLLDTLDTCLFAVRTDRPESPLFRGIRTAFVESESEVPALAREHGAGILIADLLQYGGIAAEWKRATGLPVVTFHEDRQFEASSDLCINCNFFDGWNQDYSPRILSGPDYIIIHPDLQAKTRTGENSLLVTFGGSDPGGYTAKFLSDCAPRIQLHTLLHTGPFFAAELRDVPGHVELMRSPEDMFSLMARASAAVCSGGQTMYELMYLGVPCLVCPQNKHQHEFALNAEKEGLCKTAGRPGEFSFEKLPDALRGLLSRPYQPRIRVDGRGAARIRARLQALAGAA